MAGRNRSKVNFLKDKIELTRIERSRRHIFLNDELITQWGVDVDKWMKRILLYVGVHVTVNMCMLVCVCVCVCVCICMHMQV